VPGIVFPDIEALFVAHLAASLAAHSDPVTTGVRVATEKTSSPARQVIVRDDGGPMLGDVRAVARLGVNVWAATSGDVSRLAAIVTALINDWPDGEPVVLANATRAYPVADAAGPLRYLTAEVWLRGVNL